MHRPLTWLIRGQQRYWGLCNVACSKGSHYQGNFTCIKPNTILTRNYGTRHSFDHFNEEDTLSYKVLEHMRAQPIYSGISKAEVKTSAGSSAFGDKYAVKQLLLVIAHSTQVKKDDVLQLFSLYASSEHHVTLDVISDKALMNSVLSKVNQSLHSMKPADIQQLALSLRKLDFQKIGFLSRLAGNIAIHCEHIALESDYSEALKLFDILLILYGNRIYKKEQFDTFMTIFEANIEVAPQYDLVQILHYIGLAKNRKFSKEYANKAIKQLEPHFHSLLFTDAGIATAGIFKSGVILDPSSITVKAIVKHLKSKLKELRVNHELESYGIVAMIKLLRITRYLDTELVSLLSTFIFEADESFMSPQIVPHILAFYANSRVYDQNVFCKLENTILNDLKAANSQIRMRDLTRILWCFSHTGHKFSSILHLEMTKSLREFAHCREVTISPHLLSDALLSLAVCGHYPNDLIKEAFESRMVMGLKGHQRSKQLSRLLLLSECLRIEAPEVTVNTPSVSNKELPFRTLSDEIFYRPMFANLWEGAKHLNEILGAQIFKLKFVVPYINYASLILDLNSLSHLGNVTSMEYVAHQEHITQQLHLVKEKSEGQSVAIELLDSKLLVQETLQPIGIIHLKLRLMRNTGWNVIEVNANEIEDLASDTRAVAALIMDKVTKCN